MITVLSPNGRYRASVSDHDDGVHVIVRRTGDVRFQMEPCATALVDAPLHLVLDRVADILAELEDA